MSFCWPRIQAAQTTTTTTTSTTSTTTMFTKYSRIKWKPKKSTNSSTSHTNWSPFNCLADPSSHPIGTAVARQQVVAQRMLFRALFWSEHLPLSGGGREHILWRQQGLVGRGALGAVSMRPTELLPLDLRGPISFESDAKICIISQWLCVALQCTYRERQTDRQT